MAYATPRTWTTGELATAAMLNQDVRDNVAWLANPPACRVHNGSTSQTHNTTATWQALTFNAENYDTALLHDTSTNTSRITIPAGAGGLYEFKGTVQFAANATGERIIGFRVNGSGGTGPGYTGGHLGPASASFVAILHYVDQIKLVAGDYVELVAYQTSGGSLAMAANSSESRPNFSARWVGLG
jgi:hypothetical protein